MSAGTVIGGVKGAVWAVEEVQAAAAAARTTSLIYALEMAHAPAGGFIAGGTLGAAAGMGLTLSFGVGWGIGTAIYPWMDRNVIGPMYGF